MRERVAGGNRSGSWRLFLFVPIALVALNASLTFENVWPTPRIRWANALSLQPAVGVLLLAMAQRFARGLSRRVLPVLWVLIVVGHYLDVTAPGLYGREFNVYWDSQHLGNVTAMLALAAPMWLIALAAIALIAIVVAMFGVARLAGKAGGGG